jgi:hypothetical protein
MKSDPTSYGQLAAALAPLGITRNDKGEADGRFVYRAYTQVRRWN